MQANQQQLEVIFKLQDTLNGRFGWSQKELLALPEEERLQRIRNFLEVLSVEVGEAMKASKARWWKQEKDWQGFKHLQEEIIDAFHFLASAFIATGGSSEDFFRIYTEKNSFNHQRKDWAINDNSQTPTNHQGESGSQGSNGGALS
jgi:dimeric dUTPase (all-alpha-NTP-PPase superfamily)